MSDRTVFDFLLIFYLVGILLGLLAIDGLSKFNRRLREENRRRRLREEKELAEAFGLPYDAVQPR